MRGDRIRRRWSCLHVLGIVALFSPPLASGPALAQASQGGSPITVTTGHTAYSVAFEPHGRWLASGGEDGIKVWDIATGRLLRTMLENGSSQVAVSPDGRRIASVYYPLTRTPGSIHVWNPETGALLWKRDNGDTSQSWMDVSYSRDGGRCSCCRIARCRAGRPKLESNSARIVLLQAMILAFMRSRHRRMDALFL
jgi:WD40 repeat protein